jgi:aspartate/methionine/tyrosine aminotransferase
MTRVAIVGSRPSGDRHQDARVRESVRAYVRTLPADTVIVSGGASGVDTWAENAAIEYGLDVLIFKPDWKLHGKSAGMIRNAQIVEAADSVTAFWNGISAGTKNSIDRARKAGKPVLINPVVTP